MVVNILTLVFVIRADLIPDHEAETLSAISRFFENVGHLYDHNQVQALIPVTMTFMPIVSLFTVIQLTIACIMYLCYLIRVIEKISLKDFCRKREDKRMTKIVLENHRQGLMREDLRQQHSRKSSSRMPELATVEIRSPRPQLLIANQ